MKSESEVAQSCPTLATPWTAAYQAPPSMGFSRRKYWSGLPLNSPRPQKSSGELKISCDLGGVHLLWKLKTTGKSTFDIFFPSLTDANLLNALDGGAGPGKCRLRRLFRLSP